MPEDKLKFLGDRIRSARKDCGLTQQALADQADLAVKTIQDVERGRKNTTYETLCQLIERLGISPNSLFPSQMSPEDEYLRVFLRPFVSNTAIPRLSLFTQRLNCLFQVSSVVTAVASGR